MNMRVGAEAKELLREAKSYEWLEADPIVYDYWIERGVVLIRRMTKECLYMKTEGTRGGKTIALQGTPEEFQELYDRRKEFLETFIEMRVVNWEEIKELIKWAPRVPTCC